VGRDILWHRFLLQAEIQVSPGTGLLIAAVVITYLFQLLKGAGMRSGHFNGLGRMDAPRRKKQYTKGLKRADTKKALKSLG
jgi:hypothetical protein